MVLSIVGASGYKDLGALVILNLRRYVLTRGDTLSVSFILTLCIPKSSSSTFFPSISNLTFVLS
jgi:hypothetical protein